MSEEIFICILVQRAATAGYRRSDRHVVEKSRLTTRVYQMRPMIFEMRAFSGKKSSRQGLDCSVKGKLIGMKDMHSSRIEVEPSLFLETTSQCFAR